MGGRNGENNLSSEFRPKGSRCKQNTAVANSPKYCVCMMFASWNICMAHQRPESPIDGLFPAFSELPNPQPATKHNTDAGRSVSASSVQSVCHVDYVARVNCGNTVRNYIRPVT